MLPGKRLPFPGRRPYVSGMTDTTPIPSLVRGLCVLSALVCAAIAFSAIAAGTETAANLGLAFAKPAGQIEFLTFYAGFYLGLVVLFLLALGSRALATGAMAMLALSNAGAFVARVVAMAALDTSSGMLIGLAAGEVGLAALGAWGWLRLRRA